MATRISGFIGISTGATRRNITSVLREHEMILKKLSADPQADDDDRRLAQSEFDRLRKIREVL